MISKFIEKQNPYNNSNTKIRDLTPPPIRQSAEKPTNLSTKVSPSRTKTYENSYVDGTATGINSPNRHCGKILETIEEKPRIIVSTQATPTKIKMDNNKFNVALKNIVEGRSTSTVHGKQKSGSKMPPKDKSLKTKTIGIRKSSTINTTAIDTSIKLLERTKYNK